MYALFLAPAPSPNLSFFRFVKPLIILTKHNVHIIPYYERFTFDIVDIIISLKVGLQLGHMALISDFP